MASAVPRHGADWLRARADLGEVDAACVPVLVGAVQLDAQGLGLDALAQGLGPELVEQGLLDLGGELQVPGRRHVGGVGVDRLPLGEVGDRRERLAGLEQADVERVLAGLEECSALLQPLLKPTMFGRRASLAGPKPVPVECSPAFMHHLKATLNPQQEQAVISAAHHTGSVANSSRPKDGRFTLIKGPPGTGKTLLARAIAGEANVPFFSISGSDFVEMFVGVGASRVRDMFEQGKKHAPCLVFIDEIDAVGRHRGHGMGGGHDEREQTLNALLVEMDGFDTQEGVIIIAATNRPDVLDPALLRPGRFDRQVTVSLPDVKGREQILKVHAKKIKLAAGTDLGTVARGTPGFSGAELANIINESALLAASKDLKAVTVAELEEARDKVRWGRERRSLALSEKEKKLTAYHEAGHALLLATLENTDQLHKVTIIPRGPYLGAAFHLPEEDKFQVHKIEGLEQLIVTMGGRVAEEIVFGDVTNGASGDIRQATSLARRMVCEWGMSEELGMVEYGEAREEVFLARDISKPKNYSEETAKKIDAEIRRIIDRAYADAKKILTKNRDKLELIAEALLEFETLDGAHIMDLIEHGEMKSPPRSPKPPELPSDPEPTASLKGDNEQQEEDDGPLPDPVPA